MAESGRDEVYVRAFPEGEGKWQFSSSGGIRPCWRRDGRELLYISPEGTLTGVGIAVAGPSIRPGVAQPLFLTGGYTAYEATADGRRFLMVAPVEDATPSAISVVLNWPQLLRKP